MGTQVHLLVVLVCLMNNALAQPFDGLDINETAMTRPGCPYRCEGDETKVTIPYPFGIGPNCARDETFIITCNFVTSINRTRPFNTALGAQVLSISVDDTKVKVEIPPVKLNLSISESQYSKSYSGTTVASIELDWTSRATCIQVNETPRGHTNYCSPYSYCYPWNQGYGFDSDLDCLCMEGFQGNPYLLDGCQDIDECADSTRNNCSMGCENLLGGYQCFCYPGYQLSNNSYTCVYNNSIYDIPPKTYNTRPVIIGTTTSFGTLFLLLATWFIVKVVRKRNKLKLKQKFFKRNGGFLLEKQLNSGEEGNVEKTKLFTSKELEKATDHYNMNRILGQGGQGTVYKGMLTDGRIVAVKKSTKVDEGQLDQFINEVVILSRIIHRNVVKLHGCCLETEVPLLVYEFIPNGTLFHYIHDENEEFPLTWDVRLRIATEVAAALSYLHYAALLPIYHRDIKSTNILLDDKYRAKVADFGTSRSIAVDQTHLTTKVSGTFGYLDPEYYQSGLFTEKSDVYSFGVVLVELLTSQKPMISSTRSDDVRSLATHFILAMEEDRVYDIIDERMRKENRKEEIIRGANLARRCLNLKGRKRPTMKEVAMELEAIRTSNGTSTIQQHYEEVAYDTSEFPRSWETGSTSTSTACFDIQPLLIE